MGAGASRFWPISARQKHVRQRLERCLEAGVESFALAPLHPEVDQAPAATAGPAVPEVLRAVNAEAPVLVVMERAEAGSALVQVHVAPHEVIHAEGIPEGLGEGSARGLRPGFRKERLIRQISGARRLRGHVSKIILGY